MARKIVQPAKIALIIEQQRDRAGAPQTVFGCGEIPAADKRLRRGEKRAQNSLLPALVLAKVLDWLVQARSQESQNLGRGFGPPRFNQADVALGVPVCSQLCLCHAELAAAQPDPVAYRQVTTVGQCQRGSPFRVCAALVLHTV
jgi:hypothetical protein